MMVRQSHQTFKDSLNILLPNYRPMKRFTTIFKLPENGYPLTTALSGMEELDWDRLLYLVNPESLTTPVPTEFWQEGIRVFHEGALPWCNIKHLFVLGFNEGTIRPEPGVRLYSRMQSGKRLLRLDGRLQLTI